MARPAPPNLVNRSITTVRAGMLMPSDRVSVANTTFSRPLGEALLDRLAVGRDQPGVVGGQPRLEPLEPLGVAEHGQVVVGERFDVALGDGPDGRPLGPAGEPHPVAQALPDGVVAGGPAEDEDDGRQQLLVL